MLRSTAVSHQSARNLRGSVRRERAKRGQQADFVTRPNQLETTHPFTLQSVSSKGFRVDLVSDTALTKLHKVGLGATPNPAGRSYSAAPVSLAAPEASAA